MSEKPTVHDHFEGRAHCIECDGLCKLTGLDLHYTALVRAVLEFAVYNSLSGVSVFLGETLAEAGVDVNKMMIRARAAMTAHQR